MQHINRRHNFTSFLFLPSVSLPILPTNTNKTPQTMTPSTSITFVSQASIDSGVVASYGLKKRVEAVKGCRTIKKKDMKYNDAQPKMKVDPERYVSFFSLAYDLIPRSFLQFLHFDTSLHSLVVVQPPKDNIGKERVNDSCQRVLANLILPTKKQTVEADGMLCEAEPSDILPLTQSYFVF